ncbi:hypothetical protein D3C74_413040 [compost metagenome]
MSNHNKNRYTNGLYVLLILSSLSLILFTDTNTYSFSALIIAIMISVIGIVRNHYRQ